MHPADVRQAAKWKRCLKCWSVLQPAQWWLCLFAVLLSTTLPTNFPAQICWQIKRRRGKKRVDVGILGVTRGHTRPCPLCCFDIDIWKGWGGDKKSCLLISQPFSAGHSSFRQQPLSPPTTWIFITPLLCPPQLYFISHPETCRAVFDWPWHLKRSLNKGKKSCLWKLENTTWSREEEKNGILKETAHAYLNTNGCMKCAD